MRYLRRPTSRERFLKTYALEAARLRDMANSVTTPRLRSRLLEEADNQERLAQLNQMGANQLHHTRLPW